jgi:hypothetical protein
LRTRGDLPKDLAIGENGEDDATISFTSDNEDDEQIAPQNRKLDLPSDDSDEINIDDI